VELFKRKNSRSWQYDFTVRGERFRGSTKESNKTAAQAKAAHLFTELAAGKDYRTCRKAPQLAEFAIRFLSFVENAKLAEKSKDYLRNGWRLLEGTSIPGMRIDRIRAEDVDALAFSGSAYNVNCALKTLRRMLNLAQEWDLIAKVPRIKLAKEIGRSLLLNEEAERRLLSFCGPLLRDIIILLRDTGMRPKKELFPMRVENLDWNNRVIFVPDSKTPTGRRYIPMSDRVVDLLMLRCAGKREGWVFPAASVTGHIVTIDKQFQKARADADLPVGLKLYCSRHDFGTEMLQRTGNLALVMRVMGQTSTKAAMQYQHPDLEHVRMALNVARTKPAQGMRVN
jgi:integrase